MTLLRTPLILLVAFLAGCSMMRPGEWTTLIDGEKGLENWYVVGNANWRGTDGAIQADSNPDKASSFLLSRLTYRDFQVRVEFWASDDANSGIYMRCADAEKLTDRTCYEANIFDERKDPTYGTGGIVHFAEANPQTKAGGKWSTYEITAKGRQFTVVLNGQKTAELHNGLYAEGPIGLQHGNGTIKFRKVAIKPLQ